MVGMTSSSDLPKPILRMPQASSSRIILTAPAPPPVPQIQLKPQTPNHPPSRGLTQADQRIVAAVDVKLPRWHGPQAVIPGPSHIGGIRGSGWWAENALDQDRTSRTRITGLLDTIGSYRDTQYVRVKA